MKTRVLFFAFILCEFSNLTKAVPAAGSVYKPGYYQIPGTNGLYKFHDTSKKWDEAVATCAAEGAILYYADNEHEFNTVISFWTTVKSAFPGPLFYGVLRFDGDFKTVTGIPVSNVYDDWLLREPNNERGNENCIDIRLREMWGLNDGSCDVPKSFICKLSLLDVQCSSPTNDESTAGNIVKTGYYAIPSTNGLYKYHDQRVAWDEAAATCAAEGASLYYAENGNEFHNVISYWQHIKSDFPKNFFNGIKKSNGDFKTISGIPMSTVYEGWLPGEPNNTNGVEHCVESRNQTVIWGLNDENCDSGRGFICKWPLINMKCTTSTFNDELTEGNMVTPSGYHDIPNTNGLYKYYDTPKSWIDSAKTCAADGASLYYADNENDLNTVLYYWQRNIISFPYKINYGVMKHEGVFITVDDKPISNVFHEWAPGEPNNLGGNEVCVEAWVLNDHSTLNDKTCDTPAAFICKSPKIKEQPSEGSTEGNINIDTASGYHDIPNTNGLYKYYDTPKSWIDSTATCAADGASLYYADNDNEFHTVFNYWNNLRDDFERPFNYGVKKSEGVFKTINGIPIFNVFHRWAPGEPNNVGGNEDCVEAWDLTEPRGLNDKRCDGPAAFICKSPKIEEQCSGTSSIGYEFFEPLGKCYKVHRVPKTWTNARATCKAEGSDLAVINSLEEAAHLVRLTNKVHHVPGNFTRGVILLGFRRFHQCWITVNGGPLSNEYSCWGNRQPDGGNSEVCGAMFHNGRLNDIACERKALFICEHTVDDPNIVTEPSGKSITKLDCNKVYRNIFSYYPFFK